MSTGGLPAVRSALGRATYPPTVASVRRARLFVEAAVAATELHGLADDAGLLVSELAANAVLHARTDFDVAVYEVDGGVRVSVRDRSAALPVLTAASLTAMSGRGLALVRTLAAQWGAGPAPHTGKSVWFELVVTGTHADPRAVGGLSVEELLDAWSDADEPPAAVTLPELPAGELLVAKEEMDDVLRELQLVLLAEPGDGAAHGVRGAAPEDASTARQLDAAARAFDDVRRQVRRQVGRAVAAGHDRVALRLELPPGTAPRAEAYRTAVEAAERLAAGGSLLSVADTLTRHHAVRRAYLEHVIAAARGR